MVEQLRKQKEGIQKVDKHGIAKSDNKGFCADVRRIMSKYSIEEHFVDVPDYEHQVAVWRWWDGIRVKDGKGGSGTS